MQARKISARQPLRHSGSISHGAGKDVCGVSLDACWLAVASASCISVWRFDDVGSLSATREEQARDKGHGRVLKAMLHELDGEQRRVVTHLSMNNGLIIAAGQVWS